MTNNTIIKIAQIVNTAINEAFDFNTEIDDNNTNDIISDNLNEKLIKKSVVKFFKKYFNYNFNVDAWTVYEDADEHYFVLFPTDALNGVIYNSHNYGQLLGNDRCIDALFPTETMYSVLNTQATDGDKNREYYRNNYYNIMDKLRPLYFDKNITTSTISTPAPLFYSENFIIYSSGNYAEIPPLIYIKTNDMHIDESCINQEKFFSWVYLTNLLKTPVYVSNVYKYLRYGIFTLYDTYRNIYDDFSTAKIKHSLYQLYNHSTISDIKFLTVRGNMGFKKFTGGDKVKLKIAPRIIGGKDKKEENQALILEGEHFQLYQKYIQSCLDYKI